MTEQDPLALASDVARAAGKLALAAYGGEMEQHAKGVNDFATQVDEAAEELIVSRLLAAFPDDGILAEERGSVKGSSRFVWVIDPLDGTHNFAAQLPLWCVSIARFDTETQRPDIAAVYDPLHEELFTARAGAGAWLNGQPISVSKVGDLYSGLVACDLGYIDAFNKRVMDVTLQLRPKVRRIRMLGSGVLALVYVAVGRLDAFYHTNLKPWDLAAGWLVIDEACGRCSSWRDQDISLEQGDILVSNGHLHSALLEILAPEAAGD